MKRIIFFSLTTILSLACFVTCYALDLTQQDASQSISGRIVSKDWVADTLIVNTGSDEMTFVVPNGTKITKGTHSSSLSEININDYVTIEYYKTQHAGLKAINITVRSTES
jgi:hypothetical protein